METPKGKGWAHFLIDYSQEHDLLWVVFLDSNGECWTFPNPQVKITTNFSIGRNDVLNIDLGSISGDFNG
jgi:hypothetical protein